MRLSTVFTNNRCVASRQYGFSMLELMVVLVIVGVVTALAAPSLSQMVQSNLVRSETQRIAGLLNLARTYAITNNQAVIAFGNQSGGTLDIDIYSDSDGDTNVVYEAGDEYIRQTQGPDASSIAFGTNNAPFTDSALRFDNRGRLNETTSAILTICDTNRTVGRRIDVNLLGRVSISEIASPSAATCL